MKLVKAAIEYGSAVEIYVAPCPDYDSERIKLIERTMLYDFQPRSTSWGTKSESILKPLLVHKNAQWATDIDFSLFKNIPTIF